MGIVTVPATWTESCTTFYDWKLDKKEETEVSGDYYGDVILNLQKGLAEATAAGWITDAEAKTEFRSKVNTVAAADAAAKRKADQIASLERQLEETKSD